MKMTHDRLLDLFKQAKIVLDMLPNRMSDLSEDDLNVVVLTVTEFFNAVQSARIRLAMQRDA